MAQSFTSNQNAIRNVYIFADFILGLTEQGHQVIPLFVRSPKLSKETKNYVEFI